MKIKGNRGKKNEKMLAFSTSNKGQQADDFGAGCVAELVREIEYDNCV